MALFTFCDCVDSSLISLLPSSTPLRYVVMFTSIKLSLVGVIWLIDFSIGCCGLPGINSAFGVEIYFTV